MHCGGQQKHRFEVPWPSRIVLPFILLFAEKAFATETAASAFRASGSPTGYFSQESPQVMAGEQLNLAIATEYTRAASTGAGQVAAADLPRDGLLSGGRVINHLGVATGLFGFLEIGARVPFVLWQDARLGQMQPSGPSAARGLSLRDIDFAAKLRLLENTGLPGLRAAIATTAALGTGVSSTFTGDHRPSAIARPRFILGYGLKRLSTSVNLGYNFRRRSELSGLRTGGELAGGMSLSYELLSERLWAQGEIYGTVPVQSRASSEPRTPAEAILGLRWAAARDWLVQGGVGSSLENRNDDVPSVRALVSVGWHGLRGSRRSAIPAGGPSTSPPTPMPLPSPNPLPRIAAAR
jgi:hypothetical protein